MSKKAKQTKVSGKAAAKLLKAFKGMVCDCCDQTALDKLIVTTSKLKETDQVEFTFAFFDDKNYPGAVTAVIADEHGSEVFDCHVKM